MGEIIWTCGYGIIEGTWLEKKAKFQERLERIYRGIGKPVTVVDIRKQRSGSRNGKWFQQGHGNGMDGLISELRYDKIDIFYVAEPALFNEHGGTKYGLLKYRNVLWFHLGLGRYEQEVFEAFHRIKAVAEDGARAVLLMCGCKKAFKANGTTWNCHGVPLALELVKSLGEGWRAVHL